MKPWYESRTMWLHLITLATMVVGYVSNNHLITDPQFLKTVVATQAILGMVLRAMTTQGIGQ